MFIENSKSNNKEELLKEEGERYARLGILIKILKDELSKSAEKRTMTKFKNILRKTFTK